jgi:hypothetical protein
MVWALEMYRILAYRRMAELLAEARWAGTVAQAGPWRPAENAPRPLRGTTVVKSGRAFPAHRSQQNSSTDRRTVTCRGRY